MPASSAIANGNTSDQAQLNNVRLDAIRLLAMAGANKTVAAGAVTLAPVAGEGFYKIDTEGAAATDDLDTISGGAAGDVVALMAVSAARVVSLRNGAGNIVLPGSVVILSAVYSVLLRYDGTNWYLLDAVGFATEDGWMPADALVYVSATSFKVVGSDVTAKYCKGAKIKLTDAAAVKYFYVTASAYAAGDTTVTITGGSNYSLAGGAISAAFYSYQACPRGHPIWFDYAPTFTGFSVNPSSVSARFMLIGNACTVTHYEYGQGTSNATGFTISAPLVSANILAGAAQTRWYVALGDIIDSGAYVAVGLVYLPGNSSIFTLSKSANAAWTASGGKMASFQITYEI